eukprot:s1818_g12.t1
MIDPLLSQAAADFPHLWLERNFLSALIELMATIFVATLYLGEHPLRCGWVHHHATSRILLERMTSSGIVVLRKSGMFAALSWTAVLVEAKGVRK